MKKEIALQLADAITSGHYIRTGDTNRRTDPKTGATSFCIGGVLINLFAQAHPEIAAKETDPHSFLGCDSTLPWQVRVWAGVQSASLDHRDNKYITIAGLTYGSLQEANDHREYLKFGIGDFVVSWEDIAAWLRKNYELI
jgi:hypothetical protein